MEAFLTIYKELANKGTLFRQADHLVFYGNDLFDLNFFKKSKLQLNILHQIHSGKIIQAPKLMFQADGHWTTKKSMALIIKTADCLPVFISEGEKILALHIGWRGFTENIFEAAMAHIPNPEKANLYIGPHIGYDSFQVDVITAANILRSQGLSWNQTNQLNFTKVSHLRRDHFFVNLQGILKNKAQCLGFKKIQTTNVDTCTSPIHFSHRRNRFRTGTNYSFIVRT